MIHSKEINRTQWKFIVWTPILIGLIVFSVFSSIFFIPIDYRAWALLSGVGGMLMGWGFGLVYARYFKIKGIDK
jgi:hypothetical protein